MRIICLLSLNLITLNAFAVAPAESGSNFGAMAQQNTSQALQVFQNVNYKTLSGNQNENFFFSDGDSNADMAEIAKQFKLAPEN
jgi:hypothetical protein